MEFILSFLLMILSLFGGEGVSQDTQIESVDSGVMAEVIKVVDGDTIVVNIAGEEKTVRYIGIDTPEPYRDGEPACFSLEASLKNQEFVSGKTVRLVSGREDVDRYDRLLRYVYVDDVFVNAELIKGGYAKSLTIKPNTTFADEFIFLEKEARETKRGLWGECD